MVCRCDTRSEKVHEVRQPDDGASFSDELLHEEPDREDVLGRDEEPEHDEVLELGYDAVPKHDAVPELELVHDVEPELEQTLDVELALVHGEVKKRQPESDEGQEKVQKLPVNGAADLPKVCVAELTTRHEKRYLPEPDEEPHCSACLPLEFALNAAVPSVDDG